MPGERAYVCDAATQTIAAMQMRGKHAMLEQDDQLQLLTRALASVEKAMAGLQQAFCSQAAALTASHEQMKRGMGQRDSEIASLQDELIVARAALAESREVRHLITHLSLIRC